MAGFLTATVVVAQGGLANLSGDATLSATAFQSYPVPASLSGGGVLDISAKPQALVSAGLAGAGALTGPISPVYLLSLPLASDGALSATATQVPFPTITNITTSPFHVGDTVTITGTGFVGVTGMTVGGVAVTTGSVVNSTTITIVIPSAALGARDVVVTAASGVSAPYSITLVSAFLDFTDTFNRANNASPGSPWAVYGAPYGDWSISSNMLVNTDATNGDYLYYGPLSKDGQKATVTMGFNSAGAAFYLQVWLRSNDDMSQIGGVMLGILSLDGVVCGVGTQMYDGYGNAVGAAPNRNDLTFVAGDTFSIESLGDDVAVLKNGTPILLDNDPTHAISTGPTALGVGERTVVISSIPNFAPAGVFKIDQVRIQEIDTMPAYVLPPTIASVDTAPFRVGNLIDLNGTGYNGTVTVTVGGVAATSVSVSSSTHLTCVIPSVALGARDVVVTSSVTGTSSPFSITLVAAFTPTSETNVNRASVALPSGATEWRFRANGPGGNGGLGHSSGATARGGGGGGGGGAYVDSGWQLVSLLGATYSVTRGTAAGTNSVFSSGSRTVTAGSGGTGGNGSQTVVGTAGTAGVASQAGLTGVTLQNGGAGTAGGATSGGNSSAAGNIATSAAPGGSGGGGLSAAGSAGQSGKGGDSATATGGAAKTSAGAGNVGGTGTGGTAGGGGSGGMASAGASRAGGNGGPIGSGGGGSSPGNSGTSAGGTGQAGMTIMEWR